MIITRYLDDEEATKRAFDNEGYFRTGDLLRRIGDEYVFEGRASIDCMASHHRNCAEFR